MITSDNLPAIVNAIAWPLLVLAVILVFRKEIRALFRRIQNAKLPGGTEATFLEYGEVPFDKPTRPSITERKSLADITNLDSIKWQNTGNIFWLGHDLVWTIDTLLRGGPKETIVHGLRQAYHHAESLQLNSYRYERLPLRKTYNQSIPQAGTNYAQTDLSETLTERLLRLCIEAENSSENYWDNDTRNNYVQQIGELIDFCGRLAELRQPDYKPHP
jgi:hypothetical protein